METSFNAFLSVTPTLKELTEHVNVSTNWYIVGTMLDLDQKRLRSIEGQSGHTDIYKMIEMFNLWLTTTPASRKQVLDALRIRVVGENILADEYEKHLKELHKTTYASLCTKAVSILQRNIQSLNEALVSPVQVSQLLYSKRCISEATLDEMERIDKSRSLDDKKTTLLTAMKETVSSDYMKLKDIATVLSDVKQTRDIANEIMTKYEEKIHQEYDNTVVQLQEVIGGNEDCASDILRNNYSALSQSITEPVHVAKLLHKEVISDEALSCSVCDSRAVFLKAVRDAVNSNYKHLELLVTVLRKFSETAHIGDSIFKEYRKHFNYGDDVPESEIFLAERNRDFQQRPMSTSSESSSLDENEMSDSHGNHKILFPRDMKKKFKEMRSKLGTTIFRVRRIFNIKKNALNIDEVKELISEWFPDLKPQLSYKKTIGDVLDVLKRKCNISDISPLENLAFEFNIEDAEPIIKSFKEEAKNFSKSVSVRLCLGEELQAVATPSRLLCETVVFVFNWDPDEYTLQDIKDVLDELKPLDKFKYRLQIDKVGPGRSVVVTCYCPAEYTSSPIMAVREKIGMLQRKGLKEFIVGKDIVWDTTEYLLAQNNHLTTALKDKYKRIMVIETELASRKEQSKLENNNIKEPDSDYLTDESSDTESDTPIQEDAKAQVVWSQYSLTDPSIDECKKVISKLKDTDKSIILSRSSSDSTQFLIPTVLEKGTLKKLSIFSSLLTRGDILSFSSQLSTNKSLTTLVLNTGSISDDGVIALAQSLLPNEVLENLHLNDNPGITSDSAHSLAELLLINKKLQHLYLHRTNIDTDGVLILMESLETNNTLAKLWLDKQHEEICSTLPYYKDIENICFFSFNI